MHCTVATVLLSYEYNLDSRTALCLRFLQQKQQSFIFTQAHFTTFRIYIKVEVLQPLEYI